MQTEDQNQELGLPDAFRRSVWWRRRAELLQEASDYEGLLIELEGGAHLFRFDVRDGAWPLAAAWIVREPAPGGAKVGRHTLSLRFARDGHSARFYLQAPAEARKGEAEMLTAQRYAARFLAALNGKTPRLNAHDLRGAAHWWRFATGQTNAVPAHFPLEG